MPGNRPIQPGSLPRDEHDNVTQAALYRLILEYAADLIVRSDEQRRRIYASPSSQAILGYTPDELLGLGPTDLIHPDNLDDFLRSMTKIGPSLPGVNITFRARRKDGTYIWLEGRYRHVPEDNGLLGVLRDVTVRKGLEEALLESNAKLTAAAQTLQGMVHQDTLTSLWNRQRFDTMLAEEFFRARRQETWLALMLIDIDCFVAFNQRFGHAAADQVLLQISKLAAKTMLRPGDHVSRYGGDEIAAILPNTDGPGALVPAERLRTSIAGLGIIGISAVLPVASDLTSDVLLRAAEAALQRAKSNGRNLVCGVPEHDASRRRESRAQEPARRRAARGGL
jgi:diguanylate cyclase (GGDEF)-like protein/PAS domain S-box-containing protein